MQDRTTYLNRATVKVDMLVREEIIAFDRNEPITPQVNCSNHAVTVRRDGAVKLVDDLTGESPG